MRRFLRDGGGGRMMDAMGGDRRAVTALWTIALCCVVLAAAGFAALDQMVTARFAEGEAASFWSSGLALLDSVRLATFGGFLAGLILLPLRSTRSLGFPLLYVGLVQLFTLAGAHYGSRWLGRVPPLETVAGSDLWFAGGSSFPSNQVAFYAGLLVPLVLLLPRLSPLWLLPPLFVAAAQVVLRQHYLSDVASALALASVLAGLLSSIATKGRQ